MWNHRLSEMVIITQIDPAHFAGKITETRRGRPLERTSSEQAAQHSRRPHHAWSKALSQAAPSLPPRGTDSPRPPGPSASSQGEWRSVRGLRQARLENGGS